MKKLFDNLKILMNRYDLYQADDEVGFVFKEIISLHSELNQTVQSYYDGGN